MKESKHISLRRKFKQGKLTFEQYHVALLAVYDKNM